MRRIAQLSSFFLILTWAGSIYLHAQVDRATITGAVTDQTGAVVVGASVTVTQNETGVAYTGTSNEDGVYRIANLPLGTYTLEVKHGGFKGYVRTGISPLEGQVIGINARMEIGNVAQSVTVAATDVGALEADSSSESMTMEANAIRELPLNAANGRVAFNLLVAASPLVTNSYFYENQSMFQVEIAGRPENSSGMTIDGTESGYMAGGGSNMPGMESIQEMQLQSQIVDAEQSKNSGSSLNFVMKSGTNKFHGSAFEILQNEDLNSNDWAQNQWLSTCAPGDAACRSAHSRPKDRFNDYGGSFGGPLTIPHLYHGKDRTFFFVDYERYDQVNYATNPTGNTVPLPAMLEGNFSSLLTAGAKTGTVYQSNGQPYINPCTGQPYQYGQIFDPTTWTTLPNGQECSSPFPENIIPPGRLSAVSKKIAAMYSKYYQPKVNRLQFGNFPSYTSSNPSNTTNVLDWKVDENFSPSHHLSASANWFTQPAIAYAGGFDSGPFAGTGAQNGGKIPWGHGSMRLVDNYTFSPRVVNTFTAEAERNPYTQGPIATVNQSDYGFNSTSEFFPDVNFGGTVNGIGFTSLGGAWAQSGIKFDYPTYRYADTVAWQKGRHNVRFGTQFVAQQENYHNNNNGIQSYAFSPTTHGPATDNNLAALSAVGSGFANFMLGEVASANQAVAVDFRPRQKAIGFFAQDDFKPMPRLTLNLGLRWDQTQPEHVAGSGIDSWVNFDIHASNPNWSPYKGAWTFANAGQSFEPDRSWTQFGPHLGAAYRVSNKLVARASYGLFWIPLALPSSSDPANQVLFSGTNQVIDQTFTAGSSVFNWDSGYPGTTVYPSPLDSTQTAIPTSSPFYIPSDRTHLPHSQNIYAGIQYQLVRNVVVDARYQGTFANPNDTGRSRSINYTNNWNQYQSLLLSNNLSTEIHNAADAAALGITYPYPGFTGPVWAAISPYPQLALYGGGIAIEGPEYRGVSHFNSLVVELKARNTHGLYVDWTYTESRTNTTLDTNTILAGSQRSGFGMQNPTDYTMHPDYPADQRHVAKGYFTYDLPFGTNRKWISGHRLNYLVGGWTLGYYGSYSSAPPGGGIGNTFGLPYYYSGPRAFFANGANAHNMKNLFKGRYVNVVNPAANANDFDPADFRPGDASNPFGDVPWDFADWRWNSQCCSENVSMIKHFQVGPEGRYVFQVRSEFYNALNRHSVGGPDEGLADSTFGKITSAGGSRVGQLSARLDF